MYFAPQVSAINNINAMLAQATSSIRNENESMQAGLHAGKWGTSLMLPSSLEMTRPFMPPHGLRGTLYSCRSLYRHETYKQWLGQLFAFPRNSPISLPSFIAPNKLCLKKNTKLGYSSLSSELSSGISFIYKCPISWQP